MDEMGRTTTWINQRGTTKSLIPYWLEAGVTHTGMVKDSTRIQNKNQDRHEIQFPRLLNDGKTDVGGAWPKMKLSLRGKAKKLTRILQYVYTTFKDLETRDEIGDQVWENKGSGGRFQKGEKTVLFFSPYPPDTSVANHLRIAADRWIIGDGIYWGDTKGTGVDDYIWISPEGNVHIFPNKNTAEQSDFYATGAWGIPHDLRTGFDRRALHVGMCTRTAQEAAIPSLVPTPDHTLSLVSTG